MTCSLGLLPLLIDQCQKRGLISVKRGLLSVKRDLANDRLPPLLIDECQKRDVVSVKRDLLNDLFKSCVLPFS